MPPLQYALLTSLDYKGSVACSDDGRRLALGGYSPFDPDLTNIVYLLDRVGNTPVWEVTATVEGGTGGPANPALGPAFGSSTDLSADGLDLVVGAPLSNTTGEDPDIPEADWDISGGEVVFFHDDTGGGSWAETADFLDQELGLPASRPNEDFGANVVINSAGDLALAHAVFGGNVDPSDPSSATSGYTLVYEKSDGAWTQTDELILADAPFFHASIALSGDGNWAAVGNPSSGHGHCAIFQRVAGSFTFIEYVDPGLTAGFVGEGVYNLAFSYDGSRLFIGADESSTTAGWIYSYDGAWNKELTIDGPGDGITAVFSDNGNICFVGIPLQPETPAGYVLVLRRHFREEDSTWEWLPDQMLEAADTAEFGIELATTTTGRLLFVRSLGAIYVFERVSMAVSFDGIQYG